VFDRAEMTAGTPALLWIVLALAAGAAVALVVRSLRRDQSGELATEERQQRIFTAVTMRTTQGWVVDSETDDAAVMSRDGEHVRVAVDEHGRISFNAVSGRRGASG
jgi:hypothetical protein